MPPIEAESPQKQYDGGIIALDGLTVKIEPGIVGLVAANGAGQEHTDQAGAPAC